jgi:fructokinase
MARDGRTDKTVTFGGVEAGGTKWVLAVGSSPGDLDDVTTIPTTSPRETLERVGQFFDRHSEVTAVGIGSFGPIDLREGSPRYGTITTTPKPGWSNTNVGGFLRSRLDVPVVVDTDVNAAALAEGRWGAARDVDSFCYITVGTGIGGGVVVHGEPLHGLLHPEIGHMRIPHDVARDPFGGACPYHGDCFEGLASGEALRVRFGRDPGGVRDEEAWDLEAEYIALGLVNVVSTLSPQRIIVGGGVMNETTLLPRVRRRLADLAAGYFDAAELSAPGIDSFVVTPALGDCSGVCGALELARRAVRLPRQRRKGGLGQLPRLRPPS